MFIRMVRPSHTTLGAYNADHLIPNTDLRLRKLSVTSLASLLVLLWSTAVGYFADLEDKGDTVIHAK